MYRKSAPPAEPVTGDEAKYLCYREAWTRISLAQQNGFPFEAIAILESIIVDRIDAYLDAAGFPSSSHHESLGMLVRRWRKVHPQPATQGDFTDLRTEIDRWRVARNGAVHGIVRSPTGSAPSRIDDFLAAASTAANDGAALARALTNWCERAIRALAKRTQAEQDGV